MKDERRKKKEKRGMKNEERRNKSSTKPKDVKGNNVIGKLDCKCI